MEKKNYLILGSSGGLGCSIVKTLEEKKLSYVGTYRNQFQRLISEVPNAENNITRIDCCNPLNNTTLDNYEFKYAISTVALSDVDKAYKEPLISFKNNVIANTNIFLYCASRKIPFYFISTNDIFSGQKNTEIHEVHIGPVIPWSIEDLPVPQGVYASHKRAAEEQLLSLSAYTNVPLTIVRLSLISFFSSGANSTFIKNVLDAMKLGNTISALTDQHVAPTFVGTVAKTLISIAESGENPKFLHIAPTSWLSRYQFVQHVEQTVNKIKPEYIHPGFKIVPCVLEDLYSKGILTEKRPQYAVLEAFPGGLVGTLEEEIEKALVWYFKKNIV